MEENNGISRRSVLKNAAAASGGLTLATGIGTSSEGTSDENRQADPKPTSSIRKNRCDIADQGMTPLLKSLSRQDILATDGTTGLDLENEIESTEFSPDLDEEGYAVTTVAENPGSDTRPLLMVSKNTGEHQIGMYVEVGRNRQYAVVEPNGDSDRFLVPGEGVHGRSDRTESTISTDSRTQATTASSDPPDYYVKCFDYWTCGDTCQPCTGQGRYAVYTPLHVEVYNNPFSSFSCMSHFIVGRGSCGGRDCQCSTTDCCDGCDC